MTEEITEKRKPENADALAKAYAAVKNVALSWNGAAEHDLACSNRPFAFSPELLEGREAILNKCRADARSELMERAATLTGDAREQFLKKLERLDGAQTIGDIESIKVQLQQDLTTLVEKATQDATISAEAARQAEIGRLWGEIEKINEKGSEIFSTSPTTKEEKNEEQKLKEAVKKAHESGDHEAELAAEKELLAYWKQKGIKYHNNALVKLAEEGEHRVERSKELVPKIDPPAPSKDALAKPTTIPQLSDAGVTATPPDVSHAPPLGGKPAPQQLVSRD